MWPKALTQLIELAPHISRLVPMADRFLQSKTTDTEANRKALDAMSEGLRGDLGQVTAAHAGLYRQLTEQSDRLSAMGAELRTARAAAESAEARVAGLERGLTRQTALLSLTLVLLVVLLVFAILIFLRLHA